MAFARRVASQVAPFPGLREGSAAAGQVAVAWAVGPQAPLTAESQADALAVLFGEAIPGPGPERLDAGELARRWLGPGTPEQFSGFYAALVCDPGGRVLLGADLLGLFPIYYWYRDPVLLVGSSPELFRHHPLFASKVSAEGLAGILMTNGLVQGRALLEGVRRLTPGHVLVFVPGTRVEEVEQYRLPEADPEMDLSISGLVEVLDGVLERVVRRCVPDGEPVAHLLSGGVDSRLLAGFLHRLKIPTLAITRGESSDLEWQCARRVARRLQFEHRLAREDTNDPVAKVMHHTRWEHLANGLFTVSDGRLPNQAGPLPRRIMSGYLLDVVIPAHKTNPVDGDPFEVRFMDWFVKCNGWGLSPEVVGALMGGDAIPTAVIEGMRQDFRASAATAPRAYWKAILRHQGRFRVGGTAWRISFDSWPAFPVLDRELVDTIARMPMAAIGERRVAEELLCRAFPSLAALPVDRADFETMPLKPRVRHLLTHYVRRRLRLLPKGQGGWLPSWVERRFFVRRSSFESPGWKAVRHEAEPLRDTVGALLGRDALDRSLWPAEMAAPVADPMKGTSGAKLLVGLLLWASEHH